MKHLNIELEKIENHKDIRLIRLLQLYQYDWSEITGDGKLNDKGLYKHINLNRFWRHPESKAFIIIVSGEIAGFVMTKKYSYIENEALVNCLDEFFIMRKFRKQQIGTEVATRIFNMMHGAWQVSETNENIIGQKFWKKVISLYTNGNYQEIISNNKLWQGPIQVFESPAKLKSK